MKLFIIMCFTFFLIGCSGGDGEDTVSTQIIPTETISIALLESPNTTTQVPLLVILIEFNDQSLSQTATTWSPQIFGTSPGQLNHYFAEISQNTFSFSPASETDGTNGDGFITVHINTNHPDPANGISGFISDFAHPALLLADSKINFKFFDTNNNSIIEKEELQIMFLVAGGEQATGLRPGIWAHMSCANGEIFDTVAVMSCAGGSYTVFGERHFTFAASGNNATIGIIAHELGHGSFYLPDLYDIDGSSEGIGSFGLMGSGSWGYISSQDPGETPVHMSAWSKFQSGFLTQSNISISSNNISMNETGQINFQAIRVNTQDVDEYFLIENRSQYGYDAGMFILDLASFQGGLAIWHINESQSNNSNENQRLVDLEEADSFHLDSAGNQGNRTNLFFEGNPAINYTGELTPISTPANSNLYSGASTNISISNISASGAIMYIDLHL